VKELFLSAATARTAKLVLKRTLHLISSPSEEPCAWKFGNGQIKREKSFEVVLFPLTMNFDEETAIINLMGEAFVDNNPGIMKDL
jgi:hypothetical protein